MPGSLQQRRGTGGGQSTIFVSPCGTIQSEISCNAGTNWDNLRGAFNKKEITSESYFRVKLEKREF